MVRDGHEKLVKDRAGRAAIGGLDSIELRIPAPQCPDLLLVWTPETCHGRKPESHGNDKLLNRVWLARDGYL